jgi:DNA primase
MVIKSFLSLEKKGNGFFSICPFHTEKTPSFFLNIEKNIFYCFGCHVGGNSIKFIMLYKNFSYYESIKYLNKTFLNNSIILKNSENSELNLPNYIAKIYYQNLKNKIKYNNILSSFIKSRKLNLKIIDKFQLGFSPNKWDFIKKKFIFSKNKINDLVNIGVLVSNNNRIYDRFISRLIFPIKDINGNVLGYGGRIYKSSKYSKYLNSPESHIFSKKNILYGLYELKVNLKKRIIIVEGYIDVIMLHQFGIENVVSTLGTALSKNHLLKLKSICDEIIFCYDSDLAGQKSAFRAACLCLQFLGFFSSIKFAFLPKGYDPDSFIKNHGKKKFLFLIEKSLFIIDFIFSKINYKNKTKFIYNKIYILNKIDFVTRNINRYDIRHTLKNYFFLALNNKFTDLVSKKYEISSLSLAIRACLIIIKNPNLIKKIDIYKFFHNNKIKFNSDINIFLDLFFILKKNSTLNFIQLNKRLIKKIILKDKHFILFINKFSKIDLEKEFLLTLNKIIYNMTNI